MGRPRNTLERIRQTLLRRRIIQDSGCWDWPGSHQQQGYGLIKLHGKYRLVHRLAADIFGVGGRGPHVLHNCDRPPCFNPEHLFRGTHADNMADAAAKGRMNGSPGYPRPHPTLRCLTAEQVAMIRALAIVRAGKVGGRASGETMRGLARRYGIGIGALFQVVRRDT